MIIDAQTRGNTLLIHLKGEIDLSSADYLRQDLDELLQMHNSHNLVLNLADVSFIDSSGMGVILGRYKKLAARGGAVAIVQCQTSLLRLLKMSGLLRVVKYFHDDQQALEELGGEVIV